jgi:hypothetical protein
MPAEAQPSPKEIREQKAKIDAHIKEISLYAGINEAKYNSGTVYGKLVETIDSIDVNTLEEMTGLLPSDTEKFDEIMKSHNEYKTKLLPTGKEKIYEGGELSEDFREFTRVMSDKEKTQDERQKAFKKVNKSYASLMDGILSLYQPILNVYLELSESSKKFSKIGENIFTMAKILKEYYKAEDLLKKAIQGAKKKQKLQQQQVQQAKQEQVQHAQATA